MTCTFAAPFFLLFFFCLSLTFSKYAIMLNTDWLIQIFYLFAFVFLDLD